MPIGTIRWICFWPLIVSLSAAAQDQVVLQLGGQSSRMTVPGQIVDYTGEQITLLLKSGAGQKSYPAEQVVEVRTDWHEQHELGRRLLSERKPAEALRALQLAYEADQRAWVRREILALQIRAAMRQGNRAAAGTKWLKLLESDRTTRHFRLIPLVWAAEPPNEAAKAHAKIWLTDEADAARLLGASWLLDDGTVGEVVQRELSQLARSQDDRVRPLAQAQAWRLKLRELDVSELTLQLWESRIKEWPADFRAGPSYLLGRGWAIRREHELAATALLWTFLMDDSDPRLAARCGLDAADSLRRLGQKDAAQRIRREVAEKFPDTEFGEAASRE